MRRVLLHGQSEKDMFSDVSISVFCVYQRLKQMANTSPATNTTKLPPIKRGAVFELGTMLFVCGDVRCVGLVSATSGWEVSALDCSAFSVLSVFVSTDSAEEP